MDIESAALNNGFSTNWSKPPRGVTRGCPLSSNLFILSAEKISSKIRQNVNMKGIRKIGSNLKLSQFADDTKLFCSHLENVEKASDTVRSFGEFSGA